MPFSFQFCKQCGTNEPHRDGKCIGRTCFTTTAATNCQPPVLSNIFPMKNAQNVIHSSAAQAFVPHQQVYVTPSQIFAPSPPMLVSVTQNCGVQDSSPCAAAIQGLSVSSAIVSDSAVSGMVAEKRKATAQLDSMTISDMNWQAYEHKVKVRLDAMRAKKE